MRHFLKVAELVSALESAEVEARESARSEIRVLITKIVSTALYVVAA